MIEGVVWSPYYKQYIEAIERVQRRFSKRLPGLKEFTYEERLKFLGWPTLELRCLHTDLAQTKFCKTIVLQNFVWASSFKL